MVWHYFLVKNILTVLNSHLRHVKHSSSQNSVKQLKLVYNSVKQPKLVKIQ